MCILFAETTYLRRWRRSFFFLDLFPSLQHSPLISTFHFRVYSGSASAHCAARVGHEHELLHRAEVATQRWQQANLWLIRAPASFCSSRTTVPTTSLTASPSRTAALCNTLKRRGRGAPSTTTGHIDGAPRGSRHTRLRRGRNGRHGAAGLADENGRSPICTARRAGKGDRQALGAACW